MVCLASCSGEELYTTVQTNRENLKGASVHSVHGSLSLIKTGTAQNRKTKNGAGAN